MREISYDQAVAIWITEQVKLNCPAAAQIAKAFYFAKSFFDYVFARGDALDEHVKNCV